MVGQVAEGPYVFEVSGGRFCLDFANTVSDRPELRSIEHLNSYAALVLWGPQAGLLADDGARRLLAEAARRPAAMAAVCSWPMAGPRSLPRGRSEKSVRLGSVCAAAFAPAALAMWASIPGSSPASSPFEIG